MIDLKNFNDKLNLAIKNHKNNELLKAEELYYELLNIQPNNPQLIFYLATLYAQQKKFDVAKNYFLKLSNKSPNDPNINTNLGNIFFETGDFESALKYFDKVIEQKPNFIQAYFSKGILYNNLANYKDALKCFQKVIEIEPDNIVTLNILSSILIELNEYKKSILFIKRVLTIDPDNLNAINNLVNFFKTTQLSNLTEKSSKEFEKLFIFLFKKNTINHNDLFNNAKILFINSIKLNNSENYSLKNNLVKNTLNNELFQLMLQKSLFRDVDLENFLYDVRKEILLSMINNRQDILVPFFNFIISLAEQSFLNEFVIFQSKDEIKIINKLEEKIQKEKKINEFEVSVLACYIPLYQNKKISKKLLNYKSNNKLFNDLINIQIKEPSIENSIKKSIKPLEIISDEISKKVQDQYEINPYPRWRYATKIKNYNFQSMLNNDIRPNKIDVKSQFLNPNILVAGCGTGAQLQAISYRKNAKILAIDLSLSSLAYAKRKIEETGFKKIEFLHGDILNLSRLNRKFNIIECVGVLHHMREPIEGLKILINLIETNGVLKLGLYSEIAREQIIKARDLIDKNKYDSSIKDIRNCREMIKKHKDELIQKIVNRYDFYSTSNIRDLIFHVKEHRFSIPQISEILKKFNLEFLGFTNSEIKKKYIQAFPNDKKCTSLKNWHEFEKKNKEIFIGMYNFWVRKN